MPNLHPDWRSYLINSSQALAIPPDWSQSRKNGLPFSTHQYPAPHPMVENLNSRTCFLSLNVRASESCWIRGKTRHLSQLTFKCPYSMLWHTKWCQKMRPTSVVVVAAFLLPMLPLASGLKSPTQTNDSVHTKLLKQHGKPSPSP